MCVCVWTTDMDDVCFWRAAVNLQDILMTRGNECDNLQCSRELLRAGQSWPSHKNKTQRQKTFFCRKNVFVYAKLL